MVRTGLGAVCPNPQREPLLIFNANSSSLSRSSSSPLPSVILFNKIAGVDTEGQELQNKWQEIENRIQTSRESIEQSNMKAAAANAGLAGAVTGGIGTIVSGGLGLLGGLFKKTITDSKTNRN